MCGCRPTRPSASCREDSQFGTTDWTLFIREYTTTAEETSLAPVLTTQDSGGGEAYAYFDDIGLYEGALPAALVGIYREYQRNQQGVSESAVILSNTADLTVWADDLAARIYREDGVPDYAKPAPAAQLAGGSRRAGVRAGRCCRPRPT